MSEPVPYCPLCEQNQFDPFKKIATWSLVRCRTCGFILLSPRPSSAELLALYNSPTYFAERGQKQPDVATAVQRAQALRPLMQQFSQRVGRNGRLLEIGCGYGFLLAAAQQNGWQVTGLEPSAHAAAFARQTFGLEIIEDSAENLGQLALEPFDAILMFNVIEHLPEPLAVLRMVKKQLTPGGILWAVVPNVSSLDRHWHGDSWSAWDVPYHLWHFSPTSMTRLLQKAGFQQVETDNTFFNPLTHLKIGWRLKNLRADVRAWQIPSDNTAPSSAPPISAPVTQPLFQSSPFTRWIKTFFSERDMKIWAS